MFSGCLLSGRVRELVEVDTITCRLRDWWRYDEDIVIRSEDIWRIYQWKSGHARSIIEVGDAHEELGETAGEPKLTKPGVFDVSGFVFVDEILDEEISAWRIGYHLEFWALAMDILMQLVGGGNVTIRV